MIHIQQPHQTVICTLPDRGPVLSKILIDLVSKSTRAKLIQTVAESLTVLRCVPEATCKLGIYAARLFQLPRKTNQVVSTTVMEISIDKEINGTVDMQEGLAAVLNKDVNLQLNGTYVSVHQNIWASFNPMEDDGSAVQSIAVPSESYLIRIWGPSQNAVMEEFPGKTALIGDCSSMLIFFMLKLRGIQQTVYDLLERPSFLYALLGKKKELAIYKEMFHCDMRLRVLSINDSATNMAVTLPTQWREIIYFQWKTNCCELHLNVTELKLYCNMCNNFDLVREDFCDRGTDSIGPMDLLRPMDIGKARKCLVPMFVLMGGMSNLSVLSFHVDEIVHEVRVSLQIAGPQGLYWGQDVLCKEIPFWTM